MRGRGLVNGKIFVWLERERERGCSSFELAVVTNLYLYL